MVDKTVETFGGLDCAHNNVGIEELPTPLIEGTEENWDRIVDVDLKGIWLCMKYELIYMVAHGGGSIVNIASIAALVGSSVSCVYPASKAGIVALSKNTALRFAEGNIRVNCVCPGHVDTALTYTLKDPEVKEVLIKKCHSYAIFYLIFPTIAKHSQLW